ncbi:Calx-beta domain-containing protein [Mameliella alba]|uniref:DUF7933 domain-containing protein n=1 Tax=Mameliella alba TaxID=561184 RepID=UPI00088FDC5D|nr:Ig-like domain-containing protein [Mameliella alba]OWV47185.1 hypothetical protein CDZ96_14615 [Mameliella alba]PTR38727.1 Calx-beta domain-containing protein [Mameliella alba]GGF68919.1 hypothetical protein GCM10011319_32070 [Mameliella alba]SDD40363.1 Calx-beta domain-containing protein [Mameliella alba]
MSAIQRVLGVGLLWLMAALAPAAAQAQPTFDTEFSPSTIGPGGVSDLTFTITNGGATPVTDLAFTAVLPASVTLVGSASDDGTCAIGTLSAPDGGGTVSLSDTSIGTFASCTITVSVTSSVPGAHTLPAITLSSSVGSSMSLATDLTVDSARPGFSKSLSPSTVDIGQTTTVTYTIDNSLNAAALSFMAFNETLPSGLEVAYPANATSTCNAASPPLVTASSGSGSIALSTGSVGANSTCTVTVDLLATGAGEFELRSSELTYSSGFSSFSAGFSHDILTVTAPAGVGVVKSFAVDPVAPGGSTTLDFTLTNYDRFDTATGITFTDDLDAMLSGAVASGLPSAPCGAGSSFSGSGLLTLTGGTLAPGASCSFSVTVDVPGGAAPGTYVNTTSAATASIGGVPSVGTALGEDTLTVEALPAVLPPVLTKVFQSDPLLPNSTVDVVYTLTNPNGGSALSGLGFTDDNSNLLNSEPAQAIGLGNAVGILGAGLAVPGDCTGQLSSIPNSTLPSPPFPALPSAGFVYTGGSLAAGASCSFTITYNTGSALSNGTYSAPSMEILSNEAAAGDPALASFTWGAGDVQLSLSKVFQDDTAVTGAVVNIDFTLTNGEQTATDISFSDDLDAFLSGTTPALVVSNGCGFSSIAGTSTVTFTGGSVAINDSCTTTIAVTLGAGADGTYTNTTSDLTANIDGAGAALLLNTPASDSIDVTGADSQLPLFEVAFPDGPAIAGETVTLRYTITNPNVTSPAGDVTSIAFGHNLAVILPGSPDVTANLTPVSDTCGGTLAGSATVLSYSNGTVAAGATCTIELDVLVPAGTADGSYNAVTDNLVSSLGVTGIAATQLEVQNERIGLSKSFADDPVAPGEQVTLEFTVTNLDTTRVASSVAFTDDLGAMLTGTLYDSTLSNTCGATLTGTGTSLVDVSDISLAAGSSCTIGLAVTVPAAATPLSTAVNTTSGATGTIAGLNVTGSAATDTLSIGAGLALGFAKSFDDDTVAGGSAVLTFDIVNSSAVGASNVSFSDDLDAMLSGATATGMSASAACGSGSFTGTSILTFSGGSIDAGQTCTLTATINVPAATAPGTYTNTSSQLFVGGIATSLPASADLDVQPAPTFAKSFAPDTVFVSQASTLTFTIDNSASTLAASSLDFTDNLPAGLVVAATPNASTTCTGGTLTATGGSGTITYTGGTVSAGATCTVSVDVAPTTAGAHVNTSGDLTSSSGNSGPASDTLTAEPQPLFDKSFAASAIALSQTTTMTLTIDNSGASLAATGLDVTDNLPAGMLVAVPANAATTCTGGTLTATQGTGTVSYSGGTVAGGATCTVTVDVLATAVGSVANVTGDLTSSAGNSGNAGANLTIVPQPGFDKEFTPGLIADGFSTTLVFEIDNSQSILAATALDFTDNLPAGTEVAATPNASTTCTGGTITATGGSGTISYTGGTVAASSICTVQVDVTATTTGLLNNISGDLTSSLGNSGSASDALAVVPPPAFTKVFAPDTLGAGQVSTLTFTIDNDRPATLDATGLTFTDNLPAGMVVASSPNVVNNCSGTVTANAGSGSISLTGGQQLAGGACTIAVDVVAAAAGNYTNTSGDLTSSMGNSGPATDVLFVMPQPVFAKSFADPAIALGFETTLTFTIDNSPSIIDATALDFTDNLPAGVQVAATPAASTTCTGGTITATGGAGTISYSGGSIAAGATCTVAVNVTGTAVGAQVNTSGDLTSSLGNSGTANATLTVVPQPVFTKVFAPDTINLGQSSTLTFTIDNSGSILDASGLDFTDPLPADLVVAATPNASTTCTGGTLTATAGASSISYTGGTVPAPTTCTVSVDVTPATAGDFVNTTGDLTSVLGNSGTAADTLTVITPEIGLSGSIGGAVADGGTLDQGTLDAGTQQSLVLTVSNTGTDALTLAAAPVISGETNVVVDSVTGPLATTVPIGGDTTITILYTPATAIQTDPTTTLPFSFDLSLGNDDVDEAPYDITVSGTAQDVTAPTGYTVAFDQDPVNIANQAAVSFSFAAAEVGADYAYTITSDGGAGSVTGSGTIVSATDTITGIDVSSLPDGALTLTVVLTDAATNVGPDATDTTTKDATAPTALAIDTPLAGDGVVNAAEAASVTVSGGSVDLPNGTVVSVAVSDGAAGVVSGTATITGNAWSLTLDLSGLADGPLTVTADASDPAGNPAPQASISASKDTGIPTVTIDTPIAGDDVVNTAEAGAFTVSGTATGVVDGTIVRLILRDTGGAAVYYREAAVNGGTYSLSFDISALADGDYDLSADVTDAAGNPAVPAVTTITKDGLAPSIEIQDPDPTVADSLYANAVNAAEAAAFTASGVALNAADAVQVVITATDGAAGSVSVTTGLTAGPGAFHSWSGALDLSGLADGTITLTAEVTDSSGNSSSATTAFLKDTTAPAGYSGSFDQDPVNIANQAAIGFTFADAEVGPGVTGTDVTFDYTITSDGGGTPVTGSGTITSATQQVTGLDLSGLADGTLTLSVTLTDFKGNTGGAATATATKDTNAPVLAIDTPIEGDDVINAAEAATVVISGTSSDLPDGADVAIAVTDAASGSVTGTASVTGGTWSLTLDLTSLSDGALSVTADATDPAGNPAPQATASASKDTVAPSGYTATLDDDPVNVANETATGFTFAGAEVGATYAFTITSDGGGAPVTGTGTIATATDQVTGLDLSGLSDGTLTLTVALTDPAGNTGLDATDEALKDATAPELTIDIPLTADGVINVAEAGAVVVSGTSTGLADGAPVSVAVGDGGTSVTGTATISAGTWTMTLDLSGLSDGGLTLTADASDAAGNPAPQATATATKDATAPAGYAVTFDQDPVNNTNQAAVGFTFAGAEVGATFTYAITSDGGGTPITGTGTIATATDQVAGLDLSGLNDGTLTLTVALTDPAGNTGLDATDTAVKDAQIPTATLAGPLEAQADPFPVTLTFSEDVTGFALTSVQITNGTASLLTGSGADYGFTVTPDHDGPVEISVDAGAAADAAGNLATAAAPITVTADLTGTPNPTPLPDADGDGIPDLFETGDRDGDGIPDDQDFDPQGYFYCEDDGRIIPGGGFTVTGPSGSNSTLGTTNFINITRDGSTGELQWFALRPGTYSMSLVYPTAVGIPSTTRTSSGTLDLTSLLPSNPGVIGSSEDGATGFLADTSLAANPAFYTSFVIEPGDPYVIGNNIPMTQCAENAVTLSAATDGAEANTGTPTDVTFTLTQARVSTQDTVVSYSVGGTATSGADFTALSGTATIPAGALSVTITVPVLEDGDIEGPETVVLTVNGLVSGDLTTLLGSTLTQTATIADDDFADIAVTNVDLTTNEGGGDDATMTFVLLGAPTAPVTLSFAGDNQCTVAPATITFTAANYATPQALTIRAIDDEKVEGTHSCQPTATVASVDTRYDGAPLPLAAVTITDDLVDQIREPLTEILEDDLSETIDTQSRAFSRMAKGALDRLQAGRDLPCGTLQAFDVDGSIQIQDATGNAHGTFGSDRYNCASGSREILDGTFSLNKTEDTGVQALLQFAWQKERFTSDTSIAGYFLGGYYSRTDVRGLGDGLIDGFGVNGGVYGARGFGQGLFLDYYMAGAAGRHSFDINFDAATAPINATGDYSYLAGFAGIGISGQREFDGFVMKPRVGLDLAYARAGDADVTARQMGLTHTGAIRLDDFQGARATAEIRFESLGAPGGAEALADQMRTAFTPRLSCTLSSYEDEADCGLGLALAVERRDVANGLTWGLEVDVEQIDETRRFTFNIKRERPIANGLGSVVTRLSMPAQQTLQLEHGLQLDF